MITPTAAPAKATSGNDLDPTSSSWRINSRHSYGGVTAALNTCQEKMPRLPNHSNKPLISPATEPATEGNGSNRRSGIGGLKPSTAITPRSLICSVLYQESRAHCSYACDETGSGVRYR